MSRKLLTIREADDCPVCEEWNLVIFEDIGMSSETDRALVLFCRYCHYEETIMRPKNESWSRSINAAVRRWNKNGMS